MIQIRLTAIIAASFLLAACPSRVIDSVCAWDQPITYSSKLDTKETVDQIKAHNAGLLDACPQFKR